MTTLYESIVNGNLEETCRLTHEAVARNEACQSIIDNSLIRGMEEIGARFERKQAFVPNLLMSARAMKGALDILKPHMAKGNVSYVGKVVIGTVSGDLHDIGKNLVASMLEGCGFEVINAGVNIPAAKFVELIRTENPDILCLSALLTTTMEQMKIVIDLLKEQQLRDSVKIMVGGAPVSESFARTIGADGYSANANAAVQKAKDLLRIA